jgi:hypothetical protein
LEGDLSVEVDSFDGVADMCNMCASSMEEDVALSCFDSVMVTRALDFCILPDGGSGFGGVVDTPMR